MALPNQTNVNTTTSFFALAGSGGGGGSNLSLNNLTVSTIGNLFNYTGPTNSVFHPIYFDQSNAVGASMAAMGLKVRQRAGDAGAVVSLDVGTDYKNGTSYINSYWDGYIPMPLTMNVQNFKINDDLGTNMIVDNLTTQVPQLSTINVQTATINGQPYLAPTYLSSTSNYSSAFTVNSGSNITLLTYDFPGITAGTYEYSVPISFNASNAGGVQPLILEVYGGSAPIIDSNTTCIFDVKTNTYVFYNLRGQVYTNAGNPAIVVSGTNLGGSFDIDVTSFAGPQTAVLKKIS